MSPSVTVHGREPTSHQRTRTVTVLRVAGLVRELRGRADAGAEDERAPARARAAEAVADLEAPAAATSSCPRTSRSACEPAERPWTMTGTPPRETPFRRPLIVSERPTRGRRVETRQRRGRARLQRQVAVGGEADVVARARARRTAAAARPRRVSVVEKRPSPSVV